MFYIERFRVGFTQINTKAWFWLMIYGAHGDGCIAETRQACKGNLVQPNAKK